MGTSVVLENMPLVKLHPGPEWFIFHNPTHEFSDDDVSAVLNFPWKFVFYFSDVCLFA